MQDSVTNIIQLIDGEMNDSFYKGLARIFTLLNVSSPKAIDQLRYEHLLFVYENISQKKTELIIYTKQSPHHVKQFLKQVRRLQSRPRKTDNSIFKYFLQDLQNLAYESPNGRVPVFGRASFNECFENSSLHEGFITAKSVLNALQRAGYIEKVDNYINFLTTIPTNARTKIDLVRILSNMIYRYTATISHNYHTDNEDSKLYEMAVISMKVEGENQPIVANLLKEHLRKTITEGRKIIDAYETDSCNDNKEIGFYAFTFLNDNI